MRLLILIPFTFFLFSGCSNEEQSESANQEQMINTSSLAGKSMIENKCYSCHSPKVAKEYILAPPMIAVKEKYQEAFKSEEEFVNAFQQFLSKPNKEKARMKKAVEKHGLMPIQGSSEKEIAMIAKYIYSNDIDKPEWWNNGCETTRDTLSHAEIGLKYALTTKKALGKTLMTAIEEKGTGGALTFCNTRAIPITDSMSTLYNAKIKRVSDRPRNPNNLASKTELDKIDYFKSELKANNEIEPATEEKNNKVQFYYPIITNGMCMQCHGEKYKQVKENTLNKLAELYPSDKATGYQENEVRGIWSIVFEKE